MKRKITFPLFAALCCLALFCFSSCEKEGPIGPAGPIGARAPQGPQGPVGEGGAFKAKVFDFFDVTIEAGIGKNLLLDFDVTKEEFEQSMTLLYVTAGTNNANWLVMPGIGTGGTHEYRLWYAFPTATSSRAILQRTSGPADQAQTYLQARIIVIPLNMEAALMARGVNLNNFGEVSKALSLKVD